MGGGVEHPLCVGHGDGDGWSRGGVWVVRGMKGECMGVGQRGAGEPRGGFEFEVKRQSGRGGANMGRLAHATYFRGT